MGSSLRTHETVDDQVHTLQILRTRASNDKKQTKRKSNKTT